MDMNTEQLTNFIKNISSKYNIPIDELENIKNSVASYKCKCGSVIKNEARGIKRHEKTKKHLEFIKNNEIPDTRAAEEESEVKQVSKKNYSIIYKLKSFIDEDKIHGWYDLSFNPNAIHLLEANQDKIVWHRLSLNPNAIHLLEANQDKIDWGNLSENPNAIHLLEANPDKIEWEWLSANPNAIHLLEANPDNIDWDMLSSNRNAIHLLEANPDKIHWSWLCINPNAIHLLEANQDEIDWPMLSENPNAIHLLEANPDKIEWDSISGNLNIFTYDYEKMRENCNLYKEELIAYVYHPSRLFKNVTEETDIDELLDIYE